MPQLPPPLPTNRAFVVQFRAQPPWVPMSWDGRVKQVVSGQMTHCHALAELLAFICRVLAGSRHSEARSTCDGCDQRPALGEIVAVETA